MISVTDTAGNMSNIPVDKDLIEWSNYHSFIDEKFMFDLDDHSVLEIGPFIGFQTQVIAKYKVKSLTLVEPCQDSVVELRRKFPDAHVICNDIFDVLRDPLPCTVVVCLGLLYHLHSPLYLLELVVNRCDPEIIILDNINSERIGQGGFTYEINNIPGNRYNTHKSIPYSINIPFSDIDLALQSVGYQLTQHQQLSMFSNIDRKKNCWMGRWEKHVY